MSKNPAQSKEEESQRQKNLEAHARDIAAGHSPLLGQNAHKQKGR